jgi:hypothetical protein
MSTVKKITTVLLGAIPAVRYNLFLFKEKRKRIFTAIGAIKKPDISRTYRVNLPLYINFNDSHLQRH